MRVRAQIERDWKSALKRLIKSKGLYDTGALYDSIEISAEIDDFGVLEITIDAMDYIKYLFETFGLIDFVYYSNIVSRAYAEWISIKQKQFPMVDWAGKWTPRIVVNLPE
jgi:hypothetical protein